ncbi:MAG: hypothetical protein ACYC03_10115 [Acidovorax defluvii]
MSTLATRQCLGIPVLREQGYCRRGFATQYVFKVFNERETGTLDDCRRFIRALLRTLHKFLNSRFHGTQDQRWRTHAHHFKRPARLVQLLPRNAQSTRIQGR